MCPDATPARAEGDGLPDDLAFALLATGLRTRARTVPELAGLAVREVADVRRDLEVLQADGYLTLDGDQVSYAAPEDAAAAVVRRRADELQAEVVRRLADIVAVAGQLPELARGRDTGSAGADVFDVEIFHGPEAVVDLWHVKQARDPSRRTDVVLPDAARLFVPDPAMQKVWHQASRGEDRRARVIASIDDATHPGAQERIEQELAAGVEIRLLAHPPSWFWVADESTLALPLVWGERWPTSVVAVRSQAAAGLAAWLYERLWERAVPISTQASGWDPLLSLMNGGATLEAAARALGISERTGRRRLAEAMEHFRAPSMLALGVAWGAARRR